MMLEHVRLLTAYNTRFNGQVFAAAARVDPALLKQDRGAFFGSVLGTLNHILVADIIWLGRFYQAFKPYPALAAVSEFKQPSSLDAMLYPELDALWSARQAMDAIYGSWAHQDLRAEDLEQDLTYANTKGVVSTRNFGEVIMHVFNHQTHHRGQAGTLLYQMGEDVGVTDFLVDIPVSTS